MAAAWLRGLVFQRGDYGQLVICPGLHERRGMDIAHAAQAALHPAGDQRLALKHGVPNLDERRAEIDLHTLYYTRFSRRH